MAPIYRHSLESRQTHILPPRPTKGPPGNAVPVDSSINFKVFISVMIATFCIFILTVYVWKFGSVLRRFSIHKVLGGNASPSVRYAKSWHGWIPVAEYEAKRARRKERYRKFRQMMSWRSSHADYSWVWWDPGGVAAEKHFQDKKSLRWIPGCFRSYDFDTADSIWNPRGPVTHPEQRKRYSEKPNTGKSMSTERYGYRKYSPTLMPIAKEHRGLLDSGSLASMDGSMEGVGALVLHTGLGGANKSPAGRRDSASGAQNRKIARRWIGNIQPSTQPLSNPTLSLPHIRLKKCASLSNISKPLAEVDSTPALGSRKKSLSEGCQLKVTHVPPPACGHHLSQARIAIDQRQQHISKPPVAKVAGKSLSWRYKAWAARMQIQTFDQTPPYLLGLAGRPGSPLSGVLRAMTSSGQQSESGQRYTRSTTQSYRSESSFADTNTLGRATARMFAPRPMPHIYRDGDSAEQVNNRMLANVSQVANGVPFHQRINSTRQRGNESEVTKHTDNSTRPQSSQIEYSQQDPPHQVQNKHVSFRLPKKHQTRIGPCLGSKTRVSNPEIRLIYDLDRRLEWLSSEVEPGRKPFHFLLLANHWLNTSTWIVLDPVSRVSATQRRLYGDPRFNYPPPQPSRETIKPKYPTPHRTKIHAPRLDSWRLAINGVRRSSGVQEFLKSVELYDGSADEPPDGAIDPASWILRKPPEGFKMSDKQRNAYYEGCWGWSEKLDDWQHVPRGYRVRKVICEGKANRRRVKELAKKATDRCRKVTKRAIHSRPLNGGKPNDSPREMRQVMSGSGSIPHRRHRGHAFRRPTIAEIIAPVDNRTAVSFPAPDLRDDEVQGSARRSLTLDTEGSLECTGEASNGQEVGRAGTPHHWMSGS
ncbi:hypothetical protein FQN50_006612 [Emmonsiellopsis sp. PD_5]|nr:hypothetical protein FQN50_006612 [Emmonsiellopsis sp. PD_5]